MSSYDSDEFSVTFDAEASNEDVEREDPAESHFEVIEDGNSVVEGIEISGSEEEMDTESEPEEDNNNLTGLEMPKSSSCLGGNRCQVWIVEERG